MGSKLAKWRRRHAEARHDRQVMRALDAVSARTVQDELRAIAQAQSNR